MEPLLSIVIPVFNRAGIVRRTLRSVAAQTHRPLSVILIDNNSSDDTLTVLNRWKAENEAEDFRIKVIQESKPGACAARNAGLRHVDTEWTMFFDSDDTMLPTHVACAVQTILKMPGTDVVGFTLLHKFKDGSSRLTRFRNHDTVYNNISHSIFSTLLYCARTEIFRRAGGWDESLSMGDDVELGSRILAIEPKIEVVKMPTVIVYESDDSISNSHNRTFALIDSLRKIQNRLPDRQKHWVDLQILIQLAAYNQGDSNAGALAEFIIDATPARRRLLWKFLYAYTLHGHRGAARIYNVLRKLGL